MRRFGSVCSGIEAASVAFAPLGWEAAWLAEIEPFPSAVLAHRFPDVPNLGDMTRLAGMVERGEIEAPDILCGGTPCQSFSVAGLRQSLDDARGNLSLEFVRIADAIDRVRCAAGKQPAYILWENVPGVLNTRDNAFGAFLGGLCGSDAALDAPEAGWPGAGVVAGPRRVVAWRVLDAQFFGLAQRRKRVFVLARGGAGGWACADALLPVGHSLQGHPAPRREAREGVAGTITGGARKRGGFSHDDIPLARCVTTGEGKRQDYETCTFIAHTLTSSSGATEDGTGRGTPLVPMAFDTQQITSAANRTRVEPGLPASTLAKSSRMAIAFGWKNSASQGDSVSEHVTPTLDKSKTPAAMTGGAVRRLMPVECEKLMGFPPGWTAVPFRGKPAADGPRYKALGNSWAVPVARWVGERIAAVERIAAQEVAA